MVELKGGPQTLGLNGFLERLLYKIKDDVKSQDSAKSSLDCESSISRQCGVGFWTSSAQPSRAIDVDRRINFEIPDY
jgi:hypothetical protein